jgi:hypothetical protein
MAAHPQQDDETPPPVVDPVPEPGGLAGKNPFPERMVVPGRDGAEVELELAVVDGVVYAPRLDEYDFDPQIRQYVTNYCAAWSGSTVATGQLEQKTWPATMARRGQVVFRASMLHAMLGLKADEQLLGVDVDHLKNEVRFIVESPRLPGMPYWDGSPPLIGLPIAAYYEAVQ